MTLWRQLVSDGSASKSCLNWSQTPAASTQFIDGKAAMMVNGPWIFPTMNLAHQFNGKQFGVVPVPTRAAGQHVVVPLGGEDWMISKSGGSTAQQLAFEYIQGMQTPAMELKLAKLFGYLPAKISVAKTYQRRPAGVVGLCQPDALRAPAYARLGSQLPEDVPGHLDRDSGGLVRIPIRASRAEHCSESDQHHPDGIELAGVLH